MKNDELPPIVHFQEVSGKVGFPERNGPLIYLPFCNYRCDYCLNTKVVLGMMGEVPFEKIERHLIDFKESFVFISGGEPCLHSRLFNLVDKLKGMGLQVGVSTNGTYPDRLKSLIEDHGLDFVAMDIKTDPAKPNKWESVKLADNLLEKVIESISVINENIKRPGFGQEFRTTLYPPLVDEDDLFGIMNFINHDSIWILQQFRAKNGLLGGDKIADIKPYDENLLYNWLDRVKEHVPKTILRWP